MKDRLLIRRRSSIVDAYAYAPTQKETEQRCERNRRSDSSHIHRTASAQKHIRKTAAQSGRFDFGKAWGEQGREGTRKKIDGGTALRYCPKSCIDAVVGQAMSLDSITPSGRIVEEQLDKQLELVQKDFNSDGLAFVGPLLAGADDSIREGVEFIHDRHKVKTGQKRPKISVILDTPGGYSEIAERVADLLHRHFNAVEFIVPDRAMSAGTILVMSGDEIWMDYYSLLGPIDPQIQGSAGQLIPAHGYLVQYERLIEKSRRGSITTAELNFLIANFNPAELYQYEQEMNMSVTLLKKWLVEYKFRNWSLTETRRKKVTLAQKKKSAQRVATTLNDTRQWHSHSRGISMEILRRDVGLKINDFGKNDCVTNSVRVYYKLLRDYMVKIGTGAAVHVGKNFFPMRFAR